jgi:hypothetical protein
MRLFPVLLAGVVAAGTAGCGGGAKNAVDPVVRAAAKTVAARTMQLAFTGSTSSAGQTVRFAGSGVFDVRSRRGAFRQVLNVPGKGSIAIAERSEGFVLYMRSPLLARTLPRGRHWLKLDLEALARAQGIDVSQLSQLGAGADPTQWLTYLERIGTLKEVGSDSIRGVRTTHYHAIVDLDKVVAGTGKAAPSVVRIEQLMGSHRFPADVWIDGAGRVRREALAYTLRKPARASVRLTMDVVRLGLPVDVRLPRANDTVDLTRLASR